MFFSFFSLLMEGYGSVLIIIDPDPGDQTADGQRNNAYILTILSGLLLVELD